LPRSANLLGVYDATWELAKELPLADVLPEKSRSLSPEAVVWCRSISKVLPQLAELGHAGSTNNQPKSTMPAFQQ
jgi:hypothetical protein